MELHTTVSIPQAGFSFSYRDELMLLGSCFAEEMGHKLCADKFRVDVNPFGTLYNPASIAASLRRLLQPEPFAASDLFEGEGRYHSFAHHSRFSRPSAAEALEGINRQLALSAAKLRSCTRLILTWGTAYAYRLRSDGQIVANCHKLLDKLFERERLRLEEIVSEWEALLLTLWEQNPGLCVLFTLSPIRHWKDGAHPNQLSKATLLLAIDALQRLHPERIAYFPAYELMMDELRDYRFYADDMLHPSSLAADYICERFYGSFLSGESQTLLGEWQAIRKAIAHKPFQPGGEAYRRFILQTLLKAERLTEKFPFFELTKEIAYLRSEGQVKK
ncbi:MAG: GSCFA domain-containing protein [Tannerellaceae bacterium]|jgi:hypothetical protein|nr:GSCFA domain-containing protein [Tannerellaceae bacterium]